MNIHKSTAFLLKVIGIVLFIFISSILYEKYEKNRDNDLDRKFESIVIENDKINQRVDKWDEMRKNRNYNRN